MTEDSAVKVCVRVRPLAEREENAAENAQLYWKADNNSVHQIDGASVKSFSFDRVFTAHETTNQLYQTIAKPLVVSTVQGYNGTIFAYGQTSSGKTFSMMGCDKNPGVIPLAVEDIFQTIQTCSSKEFLLRVSYMEIYNETVSDLLVDSWKRKPLEVREALNKNIYVADLSEELVTSTAQALHWIRFGEKNRHYGKTKMNERSSRSHTIFRMILESREKSDCENSDGAIIVSHLNLVDLAGSERASQTGAEGARFKEGCNINKSLFTLGQVIKKLTDESHKGYTSYRDSKLTRILQNSLGGNAKTVIICTITPAAFDETLSTLQFASTAKKMKNDPHVTEVSDDGALLKRYRNEIVDLKRRLQEVSSVTQSTATEKELLSQLQEKDQLQREQEDRIRNLTNLLVSSNPNPAPVRQAPKRRMTWGGKMLRLAATSSASSEAVLSEMAKRRRVNVSCIEPYQEFYPPWDAFEELPEDMDATQTSITTRSFGDSPKESASGEQLRDLSEKMAALEQQLEIESCEKSAAESKAKALVDRVTELEQQLEAQQREAKLEEAQQREAKLEEAQQREAKLEEAQQREAKLEEAQTDENQMRRQFSEAIQLCESLSSEKDLLLVERDYLKEELGLSLEQIQTLEKEKSSLCKKLEEKQETDEFEMLEAQIRKDDELEQREEISLLKLVIDSSEQKCLELQTEMEMLSLQLKKKCDFIEELQAMNGKDLVQEVTLLQRSLGDAEKISMDTKKDWACLRSQNMDLKEKNGTLTLNAESHEHELASLRSQLEREKSKFKKMQFDLQKELNIAFEENVKLGSLLDGKVPKNLIDNVDLERTVTKLNKDLTACLENNTELHVQLEELQQLPDKMAELSKQLEESECVRKSLTEELQEIHTLKRELEEKVSNCEETRKTDEDIQKELEEQLEQAASELQNAQATNEAAMLEWESRLQSLCEERDALQQRMEQVPEAGSLVLSLQEQLEEEMQKLSSEEALHQQRVSELNQQMQTVSQELVSLQQERDHSFSSLAALTEERDQLKADLQENIEMMIELQDELRITQEKIRSQKECIQKLEAQTAEESAPDQPEKHEAQIRTLKVELQHLQEHKKSSSDELQTLESRVRGLSEDKDQLQQTLAALTQQKQQLQQVLDSSTDSLQTQITELEQTLHMVSEQKKSLEEQLQNHLETEEDCEKAYFKMDNVLIDDRRIHVDFSQSVSKIKWKGKGGKYTKDDFKAYEKDLESKSKLSLKNRPRPDSKYDLLLDEHEEEEQKKKKSHHRSDEKNKKSKRQRVSEEGGGRRE
uniref:Centromere-associated protein E n=1 Tax=Knipowitschia caucasica TaxID=637954 RepID=A0AAV2K8C2_KNICA